jgi:hypothetical protein
MSKESNYTPGPWSIRQEGVWSVGTDHEMTALVYGYTETQEQANAHLIAAAPDLLEALKSAIASPVCGNWYEQAAAAIAKAEGRAE